MECCLSLPEQICCPKYEQEVDKSDEKLMLFISEIQGWEAFWADLDRWLRNGSQFMDRWLRCHFSVHQTVSGSLMDSS